ncbi:two-component system response regulator YesN [Paenibacillus sp. JGP012]|uniref:response regulator transcription factor n=1 Tax=Paenibacillus sp. JGP012 TaxID=2735914 RepID=UPI00160FFE21|nr:response regulator [Paenibacillus sp. JGP012]MBB6020013.1 two-component system response regulator YesN [Paenibacillus sp. JGP012]
MYNVMIVEDSKPILRNIQMLLSSLEYPVQVAATAANGEEALEVIQKHHIDLILTDIRMPRMDGLALIEQAKEANPDLKVVLISGYSDFVYTRKALSLQVFDYLLKPVERESLEEVIGRVVEQLDQRKVKNLVDLREIIDVQHVDAGQDSGEYAPLYTQVMIMMRRQPFTGDKGAWGLEQLQAMMNSFFTPHYCRVYLSQKEDQYVVFVHHRAMDSYTSMYECLETLRRTLATHEIHVMIGGQPLSSERDKVTDIYHRIGSLLAEQQRLMQGITLDTGNPVSMVRSEAGVLDRAAEASFVQMIQLLRKENVTLKLTELLQRWLDEHVHMTEIERFMGLIVDTFAHFFEEQGSGMRLALEMRCRQLMDLPVYTDFCKELTEWIEQCFDMLQSQVRRSGSLLFEKIDEYIRLNKYSALSIRDIADKFHISPSYVSRVIKSETSVTFVQYYNRLKIEEACRLMADQPEMKFRELAELLGFTDQHYFSRVFKEYKGLRPTEYKQQLIDLS